MVCGLALHVGEDVLVRRDEEPALLHRSDQLVGDLVRVRVRVRVRIRVRVRVRVRARREA